MNSATHSQRNWIAGGVVAAVALTAMSWFFLIGPERSSAASLRSQTADVELQNDTLAAHVSVLRKQNDNLPALTKTLALKTLQLPAEPDVQSYTRQLLLQAGLKHVSVSGLVAGTPTISGAPANAGTKVTTAAGKLFAIPMSVTTVGSLQNQRGLLSAMQRVGPRSGLVTSVEFTPLSGGPGGASASIDTQNQMVVQVTIFVAPQTPAQEAQMERELNGGN